MRREFDYVFTTGGIGPTHDDITAQCIADAFGVKLILHPEAKRLLEGHYPPGQLNEARMRMAMCRKARRCCPTRSRARPGFRIGNVYVMPGVPQIMQAIFDELKHRLEGGAKVLSRSVSCRLGEGVLAQGLGDVAGRATPMSKSAPTRISGAAISA